MMLKFLFRKNPIKIPTEASFNMDTAEIDNFAQTAHRLVDQVIEKAILRLGEESEERQKTIDSIRFDLTRDNTFEYPPLQLEDYEFKNIEWLTIQEFSVEKATAKIHEFIKTWNYQDSWQYCIDHLSEDDHEFDKRFRFRVRWSIPTRRKPIPRATACVYFTFHVSKIKPKNYPVEVFYVFETNRLVHRPGQSRFREHWLKDIIESKAAVLEAINF